jgi:transposase
MAIDALMKMNAVNYYLSGKTLKSTAAHFHVHRNTIWRWINSYKKHGPDAFIRQRLLTRHWKRLPEDIEDKLRALKQAIPSLTINKARAILDKQGVYVSTKGIWGVWQRYGLTGFAREQLSISYDEYMSKVVPPDIIKTIEKHVQNGEIKEAAAVVNMLPQFPHRDVILRIPVRFLSPKRRVDRIRAEFGTIPLAQYCRKTRMLRRRLDQQKLYYSSLWVGIAECYALMWSGEPQKVLQLITSLKKRIKGIQDPRLRVVIVLIEGQAYASVLRIKDARACADKIKTIIRSSRDPYFFMGGLGGLYSMMGFFREAIYWTHRALKEAAPSYREQLYVNIAGFYTTAGDYQKALRALKKGNLEEWGFSSRSALIKAFAYLSKGDFQNASRHAIDAMLRLKKEGVRRFLHPATLVLACCHQASGDTVKAQQLLKEVIPLLKKYDLLHEYLQRTMLLGAGSVRQGIREVPSIYLITLIQKAATSLSVKDFHRALHYAYTHRILGLFMRCAPFYANLVRHLIRKNIPTGLPNSFVRMPIFYIDRPVYYVECLGRLRVSRRNVPLYKARLRPKDAAFLIHMSLNRNRKVGLAQLYANFWPFSRNPGRNLSHLLTRLRQHLGILSHDIRMRSGFLSWNVMFTTDYELFNESVARARLYEQAEEWIFARREYIRAFKLCRGTPFQRMYDQWSELTRRAFLNRLTSSLDRFEESCHQHNEMRLYHNLCNKLTKKIPVR